MELVVRDKDGREARAVIGIEDYELVDADDFMQPFLVVEEIERAIAHLLAEKLRMKNKMFLPGDRVMAYSNMGRIGKGTVIPSTDPRLKDYIKVRLDRGGLEAAFRADFCKRLVPKVKTDAEA